MRKGRVLDDADIKTSGPRPPFSTPLLASLLRLLVPRHPPLASLAVRRRWFTPSSLSSNSHLILALRNFLFIIL